MAEMQGSPAGYEGFTSSSDTESDVRKLEKVRQGVTYEF